MKATGESQKVESSEHKAPEAEKRNAGFLQIFMMGISIVLSGCTSGWNEYLNVGVGEYLISFAFCTLGYLSLVLCICEMMGIIAFSGGSYGYARCTLSPFVGYLVGMCDLLQTILYSAVFVNTIAHPFALASGDPSYLNYLPLWWIAVYTVVIVMLLPGGKLFWNIMIFVGCLTVVSMFFYCVPNFPRLNFPEYATEMIPPFAGNAHMFISQLTGPTACFMGIDILAVFGREAHDPTKNMPWGMFWTFVVTVVFAWWVTLTVVSSSPGVGPILVDKNLLFPMHMSFEDIYGITNGAANLLMVPMVFSTALAFLHAAGCQMQSMSKSGLLPAYLSKTHGANHVPVYGILTAALLGYIARVLRWHFAPHGHTLYSLSMVGACCVYISLFWCYLVFKVRYGAMDRRFTNPFGVWSAIYGICYFAIILLSILFVQMNYQAVLGFAPYIVLSIIYYYKVVEARQFFSKEEQATFMKAYVLNANRRRRQKQTASMKVIQRLMEVLSCESCRSQCSRSGVNKRPGILHSVHSFGSILTGSVSGEQEKVKSSGRTASAPALSFKQIKIPNLPLMPLPSEFEAMSSRAMKCPGTSLVIETKTQLSLSLDLYNHDVAISPKHLRCGKNSPTQHNKISPMLVVPSSHCPDNVFVTDKGTSAAGISLFRRSFYLSPQYQLEAIEQSTMYNVNAHELEGVLQSLVNGGTGSFHCIADPEDKTAMTQQVDTDDRLDPQAQAQSRKIFELIQHLSFCELPNEREGETDAENSTASAASESDNQETRGAELV